MRQLLLGVLVAMLTACGGGSGPPADLPLSSGAVSSSPSVTTSEAFRFLNQATFGATEENARALIALGDSSNAYGRWIDTQVTTPASVLLPAVEAAFPVPVPPGFNVGSLNAVRQETWFNNVVRGEDQLRQRVAFALSEIFVVSQIGALQNLPSATADFHDTLARNAFGNYRDLLEKVTLHPAMGVYLSMLGNQRAVTDTNLRPDENYAREMMQLFSIGLVELNVDGSLKRDASGEPIPTYDQDIIEGFARVFTGWKWACPTTLPACSFTSTRPQLAPIAGYNQIKPMQLFEVQHEPGEKRLLSYSGVVPMGGIIPADQGGERDLRIALDNVFNHPNVGPFIAKQLIQKLVTSNPSPAYIQRVAEKFNNDGSGVRGNLESVVRAILLDTEARTLSSGQAAGTRGKLKEPLLRLTQLWRAYGARSGGETLGSARNFPGGTSGTFGQAQGSSPSVFNFFSPFYAPPGEIADAELVAPEMQLATEYLTTQMANFFWAQGTTRTHLTAARLNVDTVFIDISDELSIASNPDALIDRIATRLLGDPDLVSSELRTAIKTQVERTAIPATNPTVAQATRVGDALYLMLISPSYALQR
ncbi:MAG: DUF1800 domain-containing protein [Steroidobacteraceae bacterium]|jgi:uncharacterized protein (DUF1800 family)|nr:DUF1800 domain-containing protein [Gammaproteobacteria bacterium]